jgi:hypothetical protein
MDRVGDGEGVGRSPFVCGVGRSPFVCGDGARGQAGECARADEKMDQAPERATMSVSQGVEPGLNEGAHGHLSRGGLPGANSAGSTGSGAGDSTRDRTGHSAIRLSAVVGFQL